MEILRRYEALWDASHETYLKKNAREEAVRKLMEELTAANFDIPDEECLKKRIKNIKDSYRADLNKIKRSKKSGAGAEDVYKPKLLWFEKADAFMRNVISGRDSSSNLVSCGYSTFIYYGLCLLVCIVFLHEQYRSIFAIVHKPTHKPCGQTETLAGSTIGACHVPSHSLILGRISTQFIYFTVQKIFL